MNWSDAKHKSSGAILLGTCALAMLTILGVVSAEQSNAVQLASTLPSNKDALAWPAPSIGTLVELPQRDIYGRAISLTTRQPVVAMPSCEACAMKRINKDLLSSLSKDPVILIFPETLAQKWAWVKDAHWRVLIEGKHQYLPSTMHDFAPTCAWVNAKGVIQQIDRTMDADGLAIGKQS